jgi:hypothetical protein
MEKAKLEEIRADAQAVTLWRNLANEWYDDDNQMLMFLFGYIAAIALLSCFRGGWVLGTFAVVGFLLYVILAYKVGKHGKAVQESLKALVPGLPEVNLLEEIYVEGSHHHFLSSPTYELVAR